MLISELRRPEILLCCIASVALAFPQQQTEVRTEVTTPSEANAAYQLGPGDEIGVWVLGIEEMADKAYRIDASGHVDLPLVGRIKVAGLTLAEFRERLVEAVAKFVKHREVTVTVREFRSQPISILGAVNKPGVVQVQGRKTLLETLSLAEGLRNDAGTRLMITRNRTCGDLPLPGAKSDDTGKYSIAEVAVGELLNGRNPAVNIPMCANDVVNVRRANTIYVIGEVRKSGGFLLPDREHVSLLEALSLAEGMTRTAAPEKAQILRASAPSSPRKGIPINIKHILAGKAPDVFLEPDDIVFLPNSRAKNAMARFAETAVMMATGVAMWRIGYSE
jgi:polysaccharide export outer membrane protein